MLVIALALVLVAAACAVLLTEASRSVIPPMAGPARETAAPEATPLETVAATPFPAIPTQRRGGEVGSAKADRARAYAFIAELPAEKNTGLDTSL